MTKIPRRALLAAVLAFSTCTSLMGAEATSNPYTLKPTFVAKQGSVEGTDLWQLMVIMKIERRDQLNQQFDKLLNELLAFVDERKNKARSIGIILYCPEESHELLMQRALPNLFQFAAERTNPEHLRAIKTGVTLSDPATGKDVAFKIGAAGITTE
ncbi:MAG: hypothetical protein ACOYNB_07850 [Aquabacterium sp.]|uniref:hypothetical protein n=1 Tax=Aquabacterium sp. TaxID=1872578 RepID=UPI003BEB7409